MSELINIINTSQKNLLVGLAGPGTGKSHTFKTIADSEEFKGKKILILSFINKLIDELIHDFQDYDNVKISTLHSFAFNKYKEFVSDAEIILEEDFDDLVCEDRQYIEGVKTNFKEKLYHGTLDNDEERFYRGRSEFYGKSSKIYSFNSIIYAVNRLFQEDESRIPDEYDLVLIDEFQDFNLLEYNLINLLNKKNKAVIVGDDDQSLYGWKNARPDLIRALYNHEDSDSFTLDYCYRCPEVIIQAVNSLFTNAKENGFLDGSENKKFLCPSNLSELKTEINNKYTHIDFLSGVKGNQLVYQISKRIKDDTSDKGSNRVLIITPSYLKQTLHEGLLKKGFHIVEFELFANEQHNKIKHRKIIEAFIVLANRKTDNLALRKVLSLYIEGDAMKALIYEAYKKKKYLWNLLQSEIKRKIESDILLFKKVKTGKEQLSDTELLRVNKIFNLKNIISKMIRGFDCIQKNSTEIEMTTTMSSKGLSADFVYYLGIDDKHMLDRETGNFSDQKICEFLVGITRAKKKLTLFSLEDENPKILDFIDARYIKQCSV